MLIRDAVPGDADVICRLAQLLYAQDRIPLVEARYRAALRRLLGDSALGRVWLTEHARGISGYLVLCFGFSLEFGGRDAFVDELVVDIPFRSQGIGTALLQHAFQACPALGVQVLHLEVDHGNPRAQALYHRLGFRDHDRYLMTRQIE